MRIRIENKANAVKIADRCRAKQIGGVHFISITEPDDPEPVWPKLQANGNGVLALFFDDVDEVDAAYGQTITQEDAWRIRDFVVWLNAHADDNDLLVVHCAAGISRSAGVAAAIHEATGWPIENAMGSDVFLDPKFCPNVLCYKTVLNELLSEFEPQARVVLDGNRNGT